MSARNGPIVRISGWALDGDRPPSGTRTRALPDGLVVVRGRNAAGKSTLASLLEATLRETAGLAPNGDAGRVVDDLAPTGQLTVHLGITRGTGVGLVGEGRGEDGGERSIVLRRSGRGPVTACDDGGRPLEGADLAALRHLLADARCVTLDQLLDHSRDLPLQRRRGDAASGGLVASAHSAVGPGSGVDRGDVTAIGADVATIDAVAAALDAAVHDLHPPGVGGSPLVALGQAALAAAADVLHLEQDHEADRSAEREELVAALASGEAALSARSTELGRYVSVPPEEALDEADRILDDLTLLLFSAPTAPEPADPPSVSNGAVARSTPNGAAAPDPARSTAAANGHDPAHSADAVSNGRRPAPPEAPAPAPPPALGSPVSTPAPAGAEPSDGGPGVVRLWLQPVLLALATGAVVAAIGLLLTGRGQPAVTVGGGAVVLLVLAAVAASPAEARLASRATNRAVPPEPAVTPTPGGTTSDSNHAAANDAGSRPDTTVRDELPTAGVDTPPPVPAISTAEPSASLLDPAAASPGAATGAAATGPAAVRVDPGDGGRRARLAALATLVQLPAAPTVADLERRRSDVAAYRTARRRADQLRADIDTRTEALTELRRRLAELDATELDATASAAVGAEHREGAPEAPSGALDLRLRQTVLACRFEDGVARWQQLVLARYLVEQLRHAPTRSFDRGAVAAPVERPLRPTADDLLRRLSGGQLRSMSTDDGGRVSVLDERGVDRPLSSCARSDAHIARLAVHLAEACVHVAEAVQTGDRATSPIGVAGGCAPLLLDDVLVGLDLDRRTAAIRVLADLAEHRQIVLFTGETEVADACRRARRGVRVVELP